MRICFFCYPFSTSKNSFSKLCEFHKCHYYILNFVLCKIYSKSKCFYVFSCFPIIPFIVGYSTFSWCQWNFLRFFLLFLDSPASIYIFFKWFSLDGCFWCFFLCWCSEIQILGIYLSTTPFPQGTLSQWLIKIGIKKTQFPSLKPGQTLEAQFMLRVSLKNQTKAMYLRWPEIVLLLGLFCCSVLLHLLCNNFFPLSAFP